MEQTTLINFCILEELLLASLGRSDQEITGKLKPLLLRLAIVVESCKSDSAVHPPPLYTSGN